MQRLMKRSTRGKKRRYKNGDDGETFAYSLVYMYISLTEKLCHKVQPRGRGLSANKRVRHGGTRGEE